MVNKNKFINSSFIVLEHDFPFCIVVLVLFPPRKKKLFSLLARLAFLLIFIVVWPLRDLLPPTAEKKNYTRRKVIERKPKVQYLLSNKILPASTLISTSQDGFYLKDVNEAVWNFHTFLVTFDKYVCLILALSFVYWMSCRFVPNFTKKMEDDESQWKLLCNAL